MPLNELREPSVSIAGACMRFDGASFYAPQTKILERVTKDDMKCGDSIDFSMVSSPNRVLTPAEKTLENVHFVFCNYFQIFVWEA